ncbi:MAG: co-chaperone GroES [Dehalococcoidales bacterium]|nr:co-chaperone GroES [Dehalococcoidales bacterium]
MKSTMKLEPLHDNVFVERDKVEETKTAGGLVLPTNAQKVPDTATVIAVGPGRMLESGKMLKVPLKPGDKILLSRHSGIDVNWDLDRRTVVPYSDILGVVRQGKKKK